MSPCRAAATSPRRCHHKYGVEIAGTVPLPLPFSLVDRPFHLNGLTTDLQMLRSGCFHSTTGSVDLRRPPSIHAFSSVDVPKPRGFARLDGIVVLFSPPQVASRLQLAGSNSCAMNRTKQQQDGRAEHGRSRIREIGYFDGFWTFPIGIGFGLDVS